MLIIICINCVVSFKLSCVTEVLTICIYGLTHILEHFCSLAVPLDSFWQINYTQNTVCQFQTESLKSQYIKFLFSLHLLWQQLNSLINLAKAKQPRFLFLSLHLEGSCPYNHKLISERN